MAGVHVKAKKCVQRVVHSMGRPFCFCCNPNNNVLPGISNKNNLQFCRSPVKLKSAKIANSYQRQWQGKKLFRNLLMSLFDTHYHSSYPGHC